MPSTEPHSLECGERRKTAKSNPCSSPFNGAALVGVRRASGFGAAVRVAVFPSTEPHSLECGELVEVPANHRREACLQRSRTRWSAESSVVSSRKSPSTTTFNGAALVGVRRVADFVGFGGVVLPSTEPHSLECGEIEQQMIFELERLDLQRSRTRWSAESCRMG